jgi:4'-phosphopantetheinyl transferase EntD
MVGALLPTGVVAVETRHDLLDVALFPEEMACIARSVMKRRREFTTVRACARQALAALGYPPTPLVPGPQGAPTWPTGVVGSMTHCDTYRAAAVAHSCEVTALGIDAEPNDPLPDGVLDLVATHEERRVLAELGARHPIVNWDRLLFSAKESLFKAYSPLTGRWLGFEEAIVTPMTDGSFTARLLVPGPSIGSRRLIDFDGRWLVREGLVITAISVLRLG